MMGIKGSLPKPNEESAQRLWDDEKTRSDLIRIGVEEPSQLSSLFVMDAREIDRITPDIAPLTDLYPKRLTDTKGDKEAVYRFGSNYMEGSAALRRFRSSSFIDTIWPNEWKKSLELYFLVRENALSFRNVREQLVGRTRFLSTANKTSNADPQRLRQ
jgi:hypothetical protein